MSSCSRDMSRSWKMGHVLLLTAEATFVTDIRVTSHSRMDEFEGVMSYCSLLKPSSWQMYNSRHIHVWMRMRHVLLLLAYATFVTDVRVTSHVCMNVYESCLTSHCTCHVRDRCSQRRQGIRSCSLKNDILCSTWCVAVCIAACVAVCVAATRGSSCTQGSHTTNQRIPILFCKSQWERSSGGGSGDRVQGGAVRGCGHDGVAMGVRVGVGRGTCKSHENGSLPWNRTTAMKVARRTAVEMWGAGVEYHFQGI